MIGGNFRLKVLGDLEAVKQFTVHVEAKKILLTIPVTEILGAAIPSA
jgi:hypothetical protein